MQLTIDLPQDLEQELIQQAALSNVSVQTLILQTLRQRILSSSVEPSPWPEAILSYQGDPDFPAFESHRDELLPATEPDLF
jgi:hypothetical protein